MSSENNETMEITENSEATEIMESKSPMERIPSGIIGLDEVIEGGFRDNTVTVILGASGTGKSTFAMQYLLAGLDNGDLRESNTLFSYSFRTYH